MLESDIRLFLGFSDECVTPSGTLRGEIIVVVNSSCKEGVPYRRICLELKGVEHNGVRDDQGEFDALLDDYTSNRTYLSRHVTLSGKKTSTEDAETAAQRRQEVMFREHHSAPYYSVIPAKMFGTPLEVAEAKAANSPPRAAEERPKLPPPPPIARKGGSDSAINKKNAINVNSNGIPSSGEVDYNATPATAPHRKNGGKYPSNQNNNNNTNNREGEDDDDDDDEDYDDNNVELDSLVHHHPSGNQCTPTTQHAVAGSEDSPVGPDEVVLHTNLKDVSLLNDCPTRGPETIAASLQRHKKETLAAAGADADVSAGKEGVAASLEQQEQQQPQQLRQRRRRQDQRLMPGRYTFPFSFRVPPWLPPSLYYSIDDASGNITYTARVRIEFYGARRTLTASKRFYVLSAISQRQLIACHEEAIDAATTSPMPPLSALFQVFSCSCWGNLCCLASDSAIEVEVALQSSRALVLWDANSAYQVLRNYRAERMGVGADEPEASASAAAAAAAATTTAGGPGAGAGGRAFNGYDAFAERKFEKHKAVANDELRDTAPTSSMDSPEDPTTLAPRSAHQEALRKRRMDVEAALPLPIGQLPLVVRVHNHCTTREIPRVRVELRETIQVFKSLEVPRMFPQPLARYDYTVAIPPGEAVTFSARMQLPQQFRRCKENDSKLLPPPGVKTANLSTATVIVVSFPGIATYVEEEDWVNGVVQLAEAVDMTDEVLDLPTRYS